MWGIGIKAHPSPARAGAGTWTELDKSIYMIKLNTWI